MPPDSPQPPIGAATQVPSPEATGGAGGAFENRVGAIALARLLRGDRLPGLGIPPERVRLQQRVSGAVLDDIVAAGTEPGGAERTIEYQIKRQLSPAPGSEDFAEIVQHVLTAIDADGTGPEQGALASGRQRFGVAARPSGALADLHRVTQIARAHDTPAGFLAVVQTATNTGVRQRHTQLRNTVKALRTPPDDGTPAPPPGDADLDDATWRAARALHVWQVDAEPDGRDVLEAQDRLQDLLPAGDPAAFFRVLLDLVQTWAPQAGSVDTAVLTARLERDGLALDAAPARRVAFAAVRTATEGLLDPGAARLGHRLALPRDPLRAQVRNALDEHPAVLLGGRAGVGKSVLARLVGQDLTAAGDVVVPIDLAGRTGGLAGVEADLRVRLADAFAGAPIGARRLLLLDGAEQALTDSAALLTALLRALPPPAGSAPPWQVLLTARDEAAPQVAERAADVLGSAPHRVAVGELLDAEVAQVVAEFPALAPIDRHPRARALLLRRPYLVDLLVRAVDRAGLPDGMVGEEDLLDMVVARLVRRDEGALPGRGLPDARSDAFLALADAAIANALPARLDLYDAEARAGLRSDDVIALVGHSWRFSHDILLDYASASRLLEPDGEQLLAQAPSPRRLLRAARLREQRRLAAAEDGIAQAWRAALAEADALAERDGPRWLDVPWEALLHLGASREPLQALAPDFLRDDGAGLLRLIDVAERLGRSQPGDTAEPVRLDAALSGPTVHLLARLAGDVPERLRPRALRLVHAHLEAAVAAGAEPDDGLEEAALLPQAVLGWTEGIGYGDPPRHATGILAMLGRHLGEPHEQWLAERARRRPSDIADAVESRWASAALARTRPDLLLRLAGLYYLGVGLALDGRTDDEGRRPRPRGQYWSPFDTDDDGFDDLDGVREHDYRQSQHLSMFPLGNNQSNPALGPFAALLASDPDRGLRLIGAVVDAATAGRAKAETGHATGDGVHSLALGPGLAHTGTDSAWMWHRRTSTGPGPALSALMALRAWTAEQVRNGTPPAAARDRVLGAGTSVAFASVAVSVLIDAIDQVTDELDMFLVHPLVWHLEVSRKVHESGGTALAVPESTRLHWTMSEVAMHLVLSGDNEQRERLAKLAAELRANAAELPGPDGALLAQRWASELDVSHYRAQRHDDGVAVSVEYPDGVTAALAASGGDQAARALSGAGIMRQAAALRDGQDDIAGALGVWRAAVAHLSGGSDGMYAPLDVASAAAGALVMAAAAGVAVDDAELADAVKVLREGAAVVADWAPPPRDALPQNNDDKPAARQHVHDMVWDDGHDRSLATVLPLLLREPQVAARAAVTARDVAAAIEQVAASPYDETRRRLVAALRPLWALPCDDPAAPHDAVLAATRRMLSTAGYGELSQAGHGYAPATLPEPLEDVLAAAEGPAVEVGSAAFAVDLLTAGEQLECGHGATAAALLDAVVDYDSRVWPATYARRHYSRTSAWRQAVDSALAGRVLRGDRDALLRRLDAFGPVGEQLAGLLTALASQAVDQQTAEQLHDAWPLVMDRLMPDHRDLTAPGISREEPNHRDVDDLDDALLLVPPEDGGHWPLRTTAELGMRWIGAFRSRADRADRAIMFAGRLFGLGTDLGIRIALSVLGDDVETLRRHSRYAVAFLRVALRDPPPGDAPRRARLLLDQLAVAGDEQALQLQQELELDA